MRSFVKKSGPPLRSRNTTTGVASQHAPTRLAGRVEPAMVVQRGLSRQHANFLRSLDVDPGILEDSEREVLAALLDAIGDQPKPAEQPVGKDRTLVADLSQNSDGSSVTIQKYVDVTTGTLDIAVSFTPNGRSSFEWKTSRRMKLRHVRIGGEFSALKAEVENEPQSQEGINAFLRGALMGDFAEDSSFSAIAGQTVVGFIPIVGQIADMRDLGAALKRAYDGETGAMLDVSIAIVGFVPGMDWLKGGNKIAKSNIVGVGSGIGKKGRKAGKKGKLHPPSKKSALEGDGVPVGKRQRLTTTEALKIAKKHELKRSINPPPWIKGKGPCFDVGKKVVVQASTSTHHFHKEWKIFLRSQKSAKDKLGQASRDLNLFTLDTGKKKISKKDIETITKALERFKKK